jgi:hypothetical protein
LREKVLKKTLSAATNAKRPRTVSNSSEQDLPQAKNPRTVAESPLHEPNSPPKKPMKKTQTLSDSSSSSDDEVDDEKSKFDKLMEIKEVPKNVTIPIGVKPVSNIKLLKESFQNKSFDEAMKEFAIKRQFVPAPKKVAPLIIPPPENDPAKRRVKKRKVEQEVHPEAHLGGIFTINNGWDKQSPEKEPPKMIPRELRTLPKIDLIDRRLLHDQVEFMEEFNGMSGPPITPTNSGDSDEEEIGKKRKMNLHSMFDSESESEKENAEDEVEVEREDKNEIEAEYSRSLQQNEMKPKQASDSGCDDDDSELMLYDDE